MPHSNGKEPRKQQVPPSFPHSRFRLLRSVHLQSIRKL